MAARVTDAKEDKRMFRGTVTGWVSVLVIALVAGRPTALPGAQFNNQVVFAVLFIVGLAYWFFAPVLAILSVVFTSKSHLKYLGQTVLDPDWNIVPDISDAALRGTYHGIPIHFQYLSRRYQPSAPVLLLECAVSMNAHLTKESTPPAGVSAQALARLWSIPGVSDLYLIERPGMDLSRFTVEPIQWLNKRGALLKAEGSWNTPWGQKEFREALEAFMAFRTI